MHHVSFISLCRLFVFILMRISIRKGECCGVTVAQGGAVAAPKITCRFPHSCRVCQHGVSPRSDGLAVGPQKRPRLPADPLQWAGVHRDTVPDSRAHAIRCHSAQTQEGEWCSEVSV